jgi:hypothetical protein
MAIGPGKYDDLCTEIRERTKASGVLLIVIGGTKGQGFACQADLITTVMLPQLLESVAADIRRDGLKAGGGGTA